MVTAEWSKPALHNSKEHSLAQEQNLLPKPNDDNEKNWYPTYSWKLNYSAQWNGQVKLASVAYFSLKYGDSLGIRLKSQQGQPTLHPLEADKLSTKKFTLGWEVLLEEILKIKFLSTLHRLTPSVGMGIGSGGFNNNFPSLPQRMLHFSGRCIVYGWLWKKRHYELPSSSIVLDILLQGAL